MKTVSINLYKFNELSPEAKEKARDWWRDGLEFTCSDDYLESIKTFCAHFGVNLQSWEVGAYCQYFFKTDAKNLNFRGLKLKDFKRDYMPTGFCADCALWQTFYDVFSKTGDAKYAFNEALEAGFKVWREDMEYQLSDEGVNDALLVNEYDFLENGTHAHF